MNVSVHNQTLLSPNPPFIWESSSTKRGTYQIFSLCASTTVICIWSAIHRDIQPRRLTGLRSYALQATWVFTAFFFPEFVFVYALKQFLDARSLMKAFVKIHGTSREPHREKREGKADNSAELRISEVRRTSCRKKSLSNLSFFQGQRKAA